MKFKDLILHREKIQLKIFLFATISLIAISYNIDVFAENNSVIEFLEDNYSYDETAVIRVIDSDMDVSSDIDYVNVNVASDADTIGTIILLQETDTSSGIFEGTVFFVLDDYTSGHRLQIVQGGEIYTAYKGTVSSASIEGTPSPITDTTELEEGKPNFTKNIKDQTSELIRPDAFLEWINNDVISSTDTGVIRVHDEYVNQDPKEIETLSVSVYVEERYDEAITVELFEIDEDTGIFEGMIFFSNTLPSSGHRLHVINNDIVAAEYSYITDPESDFLYTAVGDEITITIHYTTTSLKSQLSNGLSPEETTCSNPDHVLVKRTNENLACVYQSTADKLGWSKINMYENIENLDPLSLDTSVDQKKN